MEPHDELQALVADVRALIEHNVSRGVRVELLAGSPVGEVASVAPDGGEVGPRGGKMKRQGAGSPALTRSGAGSPRTLLAAVRSALGDCQRCGLCSSRSRVVFGVGDDDADLLVVGQWPGSLSDERGEPFVGPAGDMLDNMLVRVLGLRRDQVYLTNVIKCRPPGDRRPNAEEVRACLPFVREQIRAVRPKVILLMGDLALRAVLDVTDDLRAARGRWYELDGVGVLPTYHPADLLRQPEGKRATFNDLKALRARYDALGGRR